MNAIRIIKQIESNDLHIDGLEKYKGKSAEIIILIDETLKDDSKIRREKAYKLIDSYNGSIKNWERSDLYDR